MKLDLHPTAKIHFNEKANELLLKLTHLKKPTKSISSFKPEILTKYSFSEKEIKNLKIGMVNRHGEQFAKFFEHDSKLFGLNGEAYINMQKLAEQIQKTSSFFPVVSIKSTIDYIFSWVEETYKKITTLSLSDYLIEKCEKNIKKMEIWIPISNMHNQSEFKVGKVVFKSLTKEVFDQWEKEDKEKNPNDKENITAYFLKQREKKQGFSAATIKIFAEPERAIEIAHEEAEKAISILRFFCPENLSPKGVSYCTLLGKENIESCDYYLLDGDRLFSITSKLIGSPKAWILDDRYLSIIKEGSIDVLSNLLTNDDRTEFQTKVLDSFLLYSKNSTSKEPSDKLLYILTALESILLKNENEPIVQNIAERIAFVVGKTIDERKAIIARIKKIYNIRSRFIHHGNSIDDLETLEKFMLDSFYFFQMLIPNINNFKTKEHFIIAIDDIKLS